MNTGDIINQVYRIIEPIGSGGIGTIYLAYHENLQKYVVVKKIKDNCIDLMNLRSEVDILKSLHHMYLPQVYDFVQLPDGVFTVMDYIPGHDLKYYIDQGYQFSEEQLLIWMNQMLDVLSYLHGKGIIHCDIKPANIMITEEGNVCLIDFNISLDGENNKELIGLSSRFASPEQLKKALYRMSGCAGEDAQLDGRSDLYSLGAVMYYMMTGIMPNARRDDFIPISYIGKDINAYSDGLTNIIDKAMQENPAKRFKNADDMKKAVNHVEMWSNTYRKLTRIGYGMDIAAFVIGLVLVCMMIAGYHKMKTDAFFEAYDAYMDEVKMLYDMAYTGALEYGSYMTGDSDRDLAADEVSDAKGFDARRVLSDGIRLLNDSEYGKQFKTYDDTKANVLYGIAQAAMYIEDYEQALDYLWEAVRYNQNNGAIYRDLAIACIYCGDEAAAEDAMAEALRCGAGDSDILIIEAEIAYARGAYENAYEKAVAAAGKVYSDNEWTTIKSEASQEVKHRCVITAAASAQKCAKVLEFIDFAVETAESADTYERIFLLRKAGELCAKAVNNEKTDSEGNSVSEAKSANAEKNVNSGNSNKENVNNGNVDMGYYKEKGIFCYEAIQKSGYAGMTDLFNLAFLYGEAGRLLDDRDLLLEMYANYPEAYEVSLRLAYVSYEIEGKKTASKRDYSQTARYFERALKLCESQNIDWMSNAMMVQMNDIIQEMKAQGIVKCNCSEPSKIS